jgi:hypothetical protein
MTTANLGGFSRSIGVSRGCPPLLWRLVAGELVARFNGGGVYTQ